VYVTCLTSVLELEDTGSIRYAALQVVVTMLYSDGRRLNIKAVPFALPYSIEIQVKWL